MVWFAVLATVIALLVVAWVLLAPHHETERERLKEIPVTTPASWEYALPSEITDSVFRRIEAEWEKEHPDPRDEKVRELEIKLKAKDSLIAGKSALIAKLREENEDLRKDNNSYRSLFGQPSMELVSVNSNYDGTSTLEYETVREVDIPDFEFTQDWIEMRDTKK